LIAAENEKAEHLIANIASGLSGRLRSLVVALDRLDRLESGSGRWLSESGDAELPDAAMELTLRALRIGAEPTNFAILKSLAAEDSMTIGRLMATSSLGRLVLSERLNDLVQVGMATRLIDTDHAQITAAGAAMVALINGIAGRVADDYTDG
jgi:hypothetical protein